MHISACCRSSRKNNTWQPDQKAETFFHKYFGYPDIVFYRLKDIHITDTGKLVVGKHELCLGNKTHISFKERNSSDRARNPAKYNDVSLTPLQNKKLAFAVWTWSDGSEAIVDPRGLLHLRSADQNIPAITIVLVLGRATACWASDDTACGSLYYINEKVVTVKNAEIFYNDYIQKFINRLFL